MQSIWREARIRHGCTPNYAGILGKETRVESNAIYDLERPMVRIIPISGDAWEEPYTEILLVAQEYTPSRSRK